MAEDAIERIERFCEETRAERLTLTHEDAAVAAAALRKLAVMSYAEGEPLLRAARWLEAIREEVLGVVYR